MSYRTNRSNGYPVSNWYRNYKHYGAAGEETCYLPGLCMNPALAGKPMVAVGGLGGCGCSAQNGLGYDMTVGTPVGDQTFSIPLEQMATDAANIGINAVKTPLINMATDALVNKFWPALKPKIDAEANSILAEAKTDIEGVISEVKAEVRRDLALTIAALSVIILGGFVISARRRKAA